MKKFWKFLTDLSTREVYLLNAAGLCGAGAGMLIFNRDLNGVFVLCGAVGWFEASRHIKH